MVAQPLSRAGRSAWRKRWFQIQASLRKQSSHLPGLMNEKNTEPVRRLLIPVLWTGMGLLSWFLSTFLFAYVLSPAFIGPVRHINAIPGALFLKTTVNMVFVYSGDFLLCFLFAFILSLSTESTKPRLALFILGAIIFRLIAQADIAISQFRHYAMIPPWAVSSFLQGLIPPVLIVPLISISARKIARIIRSKK